MKNVGQKKILVFSLFLLLTFCVYAQKNRFIYIQAEHKQPFYVKLDKKLFSSAGTGYLIIPKLTDGTYDLTIGFPKNEWPLQNVTCVVKETDAGYMLKNLADKGWGLVDLQNRKIIMAQREENSSSDLSSEISEDAFSTVLASVVNDPGILRKQKKPVDTLKTVMPNPENKAENDIAIKKEEAPVLKESISEIPLIKSAEILKLKHDSTAEGISIAYLDILNGIADTVYVSISFFKPVNDLLPGSGIVKPVVQKSKTGNPTVDAKFIDMELPNPNLKTDTVTKETDSVFVEEKKVIADEPGNVPGKTGNDENNMNPACKSVALYNDFLDLRKLMAAELSDSAMIGIALKKFTLSCFTTDQVKNLGALFINDEGKYKFYVAAYPFVSDLVNFSSLETQLSKEYFITRFKAMVLQKKSRK